MTKMRILVAAAIMLIALSAIAAPPYVPIQGIMKNAQGIILDGEISMVFSLYASEAGGDSLWSENQQVFLEDGLFTVYLGQVTDLDLSVFRDNQQVWLGIQVATDEEMPRVYLGSTPFTGFAEYCGSVPEHAHSYSDLTGTLPVGSLPSNVCLGDQYCPGTDKVSGIDGSGELVCSADQGGGGGSYQAGAGLNLTGDTFSVDTTVIQSRVGQTCAVGSAIREISESGTVTCESDFPVDPAAVQSRVTGSCAPDHAIQEIHQDGSVLCTSGSTGNPHLVYDSSWMPVMFQTPMMLEHGHSGEHFVFGVARAYDYLAGRFTSPIMGNNYYAYPNAYVTQTATAVGINAKSYIGAINNLGDRNNVYLYSGDMRIRVFDRTPDFDSGWQPCAANNNYIISHGLSSIPHFALLEVAENADGSGWRVPTMTSDNLATSTWWAQTAIVALDSSQVTIRTHSYLSAFYSYSGADLSPTTGFYRLRMYDWQPDFDSGWISTSTAAGDRDKLIEHGLGQEPSLFILWVAQGADGSGWIMPAMNSYHRGFTEGVGMIHLNERWAAVKGSSGCVVRFVDSGGSGQCPTSGHVRFLAWR